MEPPSCAVCGVDVDPAAGRVRVAEGTERRRRSDPREVGHPDGAVWLCAVHAPHAPHSTPPASVPDLPERDAAESLTLDGFHARLRALIDDLALEQGRPVPELVATSTREWTPMDGATAPDCPYVDRHRLASAEPAPRFELVREEAWWNPDDRARGSVTLSVRGGDTTATISGHLPADGSSMVIAEIVVTGRCSDAITRAVASLGG